MVKHELLSLSPSPKSKRRLPIVSFNDRPIKKVFYRFLNAFESEKRKKISTTILVRFDKQLLLKQTYK